MHSFHFTEPGTGRDVHIHHHGDYSGDAIVVVQADSETVLECKVPCAALVQFAGEAARNKIIAAIEDVDL